MKILDKQTNTSSLLNNRSVLYLTLYTAFQCPLSLCCHNKILEQTLWGSCMWWILFYFFILSFKISLYKYVQKNVKISSPVSHSIPSPRGSHEDFVLISFICICFHGHFCISNHQQDQAVHSVLQPAVFSLAQMSQGICLPGTCRSISVFQPYIVFCCMDTW